MTSQRFGSQYEGWKHATIESGAPTVENNLINPGFGSTVEVMVRMPGGVTAVDVVFYRYAVVDGVTYVAAAQSTSLTGHASEVRTHFVTYTHRADRFAIRSANQTGAGDLKVAYRLS